MMNLFYENYINILFSFLQWEICLNLYISIGIIFIFIYKKTLILGDKFFFILASRIFLK
jgi:hypothetical protein